MVMHFVPHGVFAAALIASAWTIWKTVAPRAGQILDALYGRQPRQETSAERWRRVHTEADRRAGDVA